MKRLAAMFCAVATSACAEPASVGDYMGQPQVKADVRIAYGPAPSQTVELFLPKGRGPHPLVVLIHGGCFLKQYEGLPQTSGIAADLAKRGFAVWNVEYRRLGEAGAGYPGTFLDVADAVDRLKTEAPRYRLNLRRVVGIGHSAGGHLALWAASRAKLPRTSPLWRADPVRIGAVLSLGGIGDLSAHEATFGAACGDALPRVIDGHYADTSPAALAPSPARVVMIHGAFDHVMPPATGRAYAETVRKAGGRAEAIEIKGAGHFDPVMPTTAAWRVVVEVLAREAAALK